MTALPEPSKLADVPDYLRRIRPGRAAPAREWAEFYERSSAIYAHVADTDRDHYYEALAISGMDREKAAKYRKEMSGNTPQ